MNLLKLSQSPFVNQRRLVNRTRITELLCWIGLDEREIYLHLSRTRGYQKAVWSFWRRPMRFVDDCLVKAKEMYYKKAKEYHPDNGGSTELMSSLNLVWERIKHLFKQHGYEI